MRPPLSRADIARRGPDPRSGHHERRHLIAERIGGLSSRIHPLVRRPADGSRRPASLYRSTKERRRRRRSGPNSRARSRGYTIGRTVVLHVMDHPIGILRDMPHGGRVTVANPTRHPPQVQQGAASAREGRGEPWTPSTRLRGAKDHCGVDATASIPRVCRRLAARVSPCRGAIGTNHVPRLSNG